MAIPRPTRRTPPTTAAADPQTEAHAAPEPKAEPETLAQAAQTLHDTSTPTRAAAEGLAYDHLDDGDDPAAGPGKAMAAPSGGAVATRSSRAQVVETEDRQTFGDLDDEVGFGSFPMVKLKDEMFEITNTEIKVSGLDGVIVGARKKVLYKASDDENDDRVAYSYDQTNEHGQVLTANGRILDDVIEEWKEDGEVTLKQSKYYEAQFMVLNVFHDAPAKQTAAREALNGQIVLLSIAPSSVARLSGMKQTLKMRKLKSGARATLDKVVTRITAGAKVVPGGDNKKAFHPWDFKPVGELPENFTVSVLDAYTLDAV